jgi:protein disulfide-isomerase A1
MLSITTVVSEPCQRLEPEFELAAEVLKERGITSISIDCAIERKLCSNQTITSYPAIRIFKGPGNFMRYRQGRKAAK